MQNNANWKENIPKDLILDREQGKNIHQFKTLKSSMKSSLKEQAYQKLNNNNNNNNNNVYSD